MRDKNHLKSMLSYALVTLTSGGLVLSVPLQAGAVVNNPVSSAKISFTFDDSLASTYTNAAPTLAKYGLTGTDYAISSCVGMTSVPNTCHANTDTPYMSWTQLKALQDTYGWEVGAHTATHPYLATSDATDGQPNVLTPSQVTAELTQSKATLVANGLKVTDFSSPYGDYNNAVLAQIAKVYASHRGFADQNNNDWPYNDYLLNNFHVEGTTTVAQVKAKIDTAIASKQWLVLTFHDILPNASTDPDDYEYSTANLDQIAAYVKSKQDANVLKSVHINQGLLTSDTNLMPNSSFNSGVGGGWTTDNSTSITKDTGNNGSYPDPANSIKLVSPASGSAHLFSPKIPITADSTYAIKTFLNVNTITSGQVAFYIDEYDSAGKWISGQYKVGEGSSFVENINIPYTPSSVNVKNASLQIIVVGAGITAYVDNVQWFSLQNSSPAPTPTPTPTPTNLISNGQFDSGMTGWTNDDAANIKLDSNNNGSPTGATNSVSLKATVANKHLFSPSVAVDSAKTYTISNYLRVTQLTNNEIGYYVDEYDTNGNWVSGQYKTGVRSVSSGNVSFSYKPTSSDVKTAKLQVIVTANSGIQAYIDDIKWY
jgi:peptidoglycan/xylan/chitin deacetylase (PgdA/CDA1 family)